MLDPRKPAEAAQFFIKNFRDTPEEKLDNLVGTLWFDHKLLTRALRTTGVHLSRRKPSGLGNSLAAAREFIRKILRRAGFGRSSRPMAALDVGGGLTSVLRIIPANRKVVVDICVDAMREAGLQLPTQIEFVNAPAESLPFPDRTFTHVFCSNALDHFEDPVAALTEIRRVLGPDGFCIIAVDVLPTDKGARNLLHPHSFTREKLESLLSGHFSILDSYPQPNGGKVGFHRLAKGDTRPRTDKDELIYVLRT
jgi:SAM-dependent methyltransferase